MKNKPAAADQKLFVQSFAKGLEVLLAFDATRSSMNLPELAAAANISKSAAQRFAFTLEALGFLRKESPGKRYSLTPKVLELGYRYLLVDRLLERANPYLLELNRQCKETVNIAEPDDTSMVYIGRFPSQRSMPVFMPLGRRLPMYCCSAGRAYLATLPADEARRLLESAPMPRYTPTTVTDVSQLLDLIQTAKQRGYSVANGEYYRGDLGIAVPISSADGGVVAAINISAPSTRWTLERLESELAPLLMETARNICDRPPDPSDLAPFRLGMLPAQET